MDPLAQRERALAGFVCAAAALVLTALAQPVLRGEVHAHNDLAFFHLPLRAFYADSIEHGGSFFWYPHQFGGYDLHGEGQLGLLHPLHLALYRALSLPRAFETELIAPLLVAGAGSWLWLRRLGLPPSAAALGAVLTALAPFQFLHFMHPNLRGVLAELPWALLALDVLLRDARSTRRAAAFLGLGLVTASQCLRGHPQALAICALAEGLYLAGRVARPRSAALRRAAQALAAAACGALIGALQLAPSFASWRSSQRGAGAADFAAGLAPAPQELLQLVAPYLLERRVIGPLTWEHSLYAGSLPLALAVWLLLRRRALGAHWPLARAVLVAAALALLLALGDAGGLYALLRRIPPFDAFRASGRFAALFQLALALASALAFSDLAARVRARQSLPWRDLRALALLPLTSLVIALAAHAFSASIGSEPSHAPGVDALRLAPLAHAAAGPLLALGAAALVAAAARGRALALPLLLVFAVLDPALYGLSFLAQEPPQRIERLLAGLPRPPELRAGERVLKAHPLLALEGLRMLQGYAALPPQRRLDLARRLGDGRDEERRAAALRLASVGWAPGRRVADPLPRVRLVAEARVSRDPWRDLASIDVATTALVDRALDAPLEVQGPASRASIRAESPGHLRIELDVHARRLLVLSESFHSGWRALCDGEPCKLLRVYGDWMGCVVEAGTRAVVFDFAPREIEGAQVAAGAGAAGLVLGALALALAGAVRRR